MKKEMFGLVFLLSLFLVSFVAAETYSSTTVVAFNSGAPSSVKKVVDYDMWRNVLAAVSLVLIIVAASMIYKLKKKKAKAKVVKKVAKKAVKKKVVRRKKR